MFKSCVAVKVGAHANSQGGACARRRHNTQKQHEPEVQSATFVTLEQTRATPFATCSIKFTSDSADTYADVPQIYGLNRILSKNASG